MCLRRVWGSRRRERRAGSSRRPLAEPDAPTKEDGAGERHPFLAEGVLILCAVERGTCFCWFVPSPVHQGPPPPCESVSGSPPIPPSIFRQPKSPEARSRFFSFLRVWRSVDAPVAPADKKRRRNQRPFRFFAEARDEEGRNHGACVSACLPTSFLPPSSFRPPATYPAPRQQKNPPAWLQAPGSKSQAPGAMDHELTTNPPTSHAHLSERKRLQIKQ